MKEKLEEAREILAAIVLGDTYRHWPIGLVRAHHLLESFLAEWIDFEADDIITLAPDAANEIVGELPDEEVPFPAA
jgi:hypothetical protein